MAKKYVGCTIKELPENEKHAAGLFAIATNPANRPAMHGLAKVGFNVNERLAIAVMTTKYFGSGGVNLSVGFLDQASAALQEKIVSHMNAWSAFANVKFTIASGPASRAQVRITLRGQGYWSYLGTDVLQIPSNQPTMCLQGFSLNTPDSEYRRVVRHETGHCIGAPHEHMRQQIVQRLDQNKTIAYFQRTQGWSADEVRQQVLTAINEPQLMGTPSAEVDSIMCYGLPASITVDGRPIPGGTDITANDGAFIGTLYPLAIQPPTPPQPTSGKLRVSFDLDPKTKTLSNPSIQ